MSLTFLEACKQYNNKSKQTDDDADGMRKQKSQFVLKEAIEAAFIKMQKDKKEDPEKKIPPKFEAFVKSDGYRELLESMLDYNRELFRLENKQ